jgi:hypothetical protein
MALAEPQAGFDLIDSIPMRQWTAENEFIASNQD